MTIFVIFRTAFRTRCIIRSRMRIVFLLAAVGICGAAYAPPVVCGPILRSSRAPSGSMYSDGRDPASPHNTQQLAATAKLQNLLRKGAQGDECVLPCDEVQCDKKGLIILLRHGESKWNAEDRFTGWHDVPLSAQGEDQAVEAAQALQAAGLDRCIDVVYASALKRTIKTAWLVLETLDDYTVPIEQAWQLNERMYGLLTGLNKKATRDYLGDELFEELRRDPPPLDRGSCYDPASAIAVRRTTPPDLVPRAESFEDTAARVLPYFREAIEPRARRGETVLLVSSKNLLRSLIYGVTDWPLDKMVSIDIPNGLPIVYRPEDGSLHVLAKDGKMQYWGRAGGECPFSTESTGNAQAEEHAEQDV